MCCACAGSCNHVGNHSFCEAHGGATHSGQVITGTWRQIIALDADFADAEMLCEAAEVIKRRRRRQSIVSDILIRVLQKMAARITS